MSAGSELGYSSNDLGTQGTGTGLESAVAKQVARARAVLMLPFSTTATLTAGVKNAAKPEPGNPVSG
jgi:hypothetical protein